VEVMMEFCSACGAQATEMILVEVVHISIKDGKQRRKVLNLMLCDACSQRASRTLARDHEQAERVARALTDEGRQLRKDEAWARRKAFLKEQAEAAL
jgi:hypothetical protein